MHDVANKCSMVLRHCVLTSITSKGALILFIYCLIIRIELTHSLVESVPTRRDSGNINEKAKNRPTGLSFGGGVVGDGCATRFAV